MNDINNMWPCNVSNMWPCCHDCPYGEVCEFPNKYLNKDNDDLLEGEE